MLVITLAWGARYRAHVTAWSESVRAAGHDPRPFEIPGKPADRRMVWPARPQMILEALEQSGGPVLHLDVDARIEIPPALPPDPALFDLAAYSPRPGTWEPGVSCWLPTDTARKVLAAWRRHLQVDPAVADDVALSRAILQHGARVLFLPPEYCWCDAWAMRERYGNRLPVVRVNVLAPLEEIVQ